MGSITRAVNLCESTLAFGAPKNRRRADHGALSTIVDDVIDSERLAAGDTECHSAEDSRRHDRARRRRAALPRLVNLVRNARQAIVATGQAGEIASTATKTIGWMIDHRYGPRPAPKAQEHLFTAFPGRCTQGRLWSWAGDRGRTGTRPRRALELNSTGPTARSSSSACPKRSRWDAEV